MCGDSSPFLAHLRGVTRNLLNTGTTSILPSPNILSYLLKARTVEPEKQPLLPNGSEIFVSRQRKQTRERRPFIVSRFLIRKNRLPLLGNGLVNTFLWEQHTGINGVVCECHTEELYWSNQVSSVLESEERVTLKEADIQRGVHFVTRNRHDINAHTEGIRRTP
jgi:hypothetical protein